MDGPISPARRAAACIAAFGALAPLVALRLAAWAHGSSWGGGGDSGRTQFEYELHATAPWAGTAATVLAVLIAVAAAGLWAARDRRVLALVVAGGLAGAAGTVTATAYAASAGVATPEDFRALPLGSTRADVRARLGAAPGDGSGTRDGRPLDCDAYWSADDDDSRFVFCFDGDRLVFKDGS